MKINWYSMGCLLLGFIVCTLIDFELSDFIAPEPNLRSHPHRNRENKYMATIIISNE